MQNPYYYITKSFSWQNFTSGHSAAVAWRVRGNGVSREPGVYPEAFISLG
jgi:hypothetical protein